MDITPPLKGRWNFFETFLRNRLASKKNGSTTRLFWGVDPEALCQKTRVDRIKREPDKTGIKAQGCILFDVRR